KPSPTATATPTPAPTATPTTAVASLSCQVNYSASQLWPGGFIANLTITNTGSSAIQGWKLVFTFPGQERILSGWNGSFTQSGAQVSITNSGSNGTLAPGSSATPGFQATSSSKNESTPAMFSLNGVTCQ
ncbi:MAG TPA: cellulose binding domain-containing protein, partial [Ktedonobacteraceae bacterium]|nr:cellulose binding domain-containing protein [Ktedonobacteraceae bacterium]